MTEDSNSGNQSDVFEDGLVGDASAMSFLEHLEEFRWTVARSLAAFVIGVVVVVILMPKIGGFLQMPLIYAYGSAEL